jgi:3,5-epimerase/4-reductase
MFSFLKKPSILFYGADGWIGGLFLDYIKLNNPSLVIIKGVSRIEHEEHVIYEIKKIKPTHIVSFTGRTHGKIENEIINTIDYLEYPGKLVENIRDNLYGPINLATICKKYNIHYTYLGTGCIFNSNLDNSKFSEESKPNYFGSSYSIVKGFTDQLMKSFPVLNLRIRMPISSEINDRNFINKITKYRYICSIANSMTVLDDFFPIFLDLILKNKTGTYNCTNPGLISHNEILTLYRDIINKDFCWENMTLGEQSKMLKSDRSNNFLETDKIEKNYPNLKNIKKSVEIVLNKMKLKEIEV